jgi:hypothetical protein
MPDQTPRVPDDAVRESGITTGEGTFYPDSHRLKNPAGFLIVMAAVFRKSGAFRDAQAAIDHARAVYLDLLPDCGGRYGAPGYAWTVGAAKEWAAEDMRHWEQAA